MVEARLVEEDVHARLNDLHEIGARCPFYELRVDMERHHQPHIDTREGCRTHSEEYRLGGQEVRCLHINILAGFEQNAHIALHDIGPGRGGIARDELCQTASRLLGTRIVLTTADKCAVNEIPIDEEGSLHRIDCTANHTQVGVAPRCHLCGLPAFLLHLSLYVAQGDVHSSDEGFAAVDDTQLTVIAIVDLTREGREMNWHERTHVDSGLAQPLKEPCRHTPTAHVVVDEPHFNTLLSTIDECIAHQPTQRIVLDNIGVDMDVMTGLSDGTQQRQEVVMTRCVDINIVVLERQRHPFVDELLHQCAIGIGNSQVALFGKLQHRALCQLVEALLTDHAFLSRVLTEEEVKDDSHDRHEREHQNPCHSLCRLTVIHQDGDHRSDYQQAVSGQEYPVQVVHAG